MMNHHPEHDRVLDLELVVRWQEQVAKRREVAVVEVEVVEQPEVVAEVVVEPVQGKKKFIIINYNQSSDYIF